MPGILCPICTPHMPSCRGYRREAFPDGPAVTHGSGHVSGRDNGDTRAHWPAGAAYRHERRVLRTRPNVSKPQSFQRWLSMSTFFQQFSQLLVKFTVNSFRREGCALVFWCDLFCVIEICDPGKHSAVNAIPHKHELRGSACTACDPSSGRAWMLRSGRRHGNRHLWMGSCSVPGTGRGASASLTNPRQPPDV